jgi:hypothetical protein
VRGIVHKYRSGVAVSATTTGSILATSRTPMMACPSTSSLVMRGAMVEVLDMLAVMDGYKGGWMIIGMVVDAGCTRSGG